MKIPGEVKGSWSTRETTQANIRDPLLCYTLIKKNPVTSRGKGRAHMSKSQVQQNTSEKESSWNEKKGTYETVFLLISSTHLIANIILDDGHFARESEKAWGRWRRGSCSLLYCGHRGKLQSSVTHLEYLAHCERHYFSLISRGFFCGFRRLWPFRKKLLGTSILGVKQEWRLCPFEGDDDESQSSELLYDKRKWEALADYVRL